jgi:hypothetical protein
MKIIKTAQYNQRSVPGERMMEYSLDFAGEPEADMQIYFTVEKAVPSTRDYPGDPAEAVITRIERKRTGEDITDAVFAEHPDLNAELHDSLLEHADTLNEDARAQEESRREEAHRLGEF